MAKAKIAAPNPSAPRAAPRVPAKRAATPAARAPKGKAKKTPQPPPPYQPPAAPASGGGYGMQYSPTLGTQMQTPYNDAMAAGAYGALPGLMGQVGQTTGLSGSAGGAYGGMIPQNTQLQNQIYSRLQDAYQGKAIFDPYIETQLGQQGQALQDQLRRSLGPDYAASSAGAEAIQRFNEMADHTRSQAQYAAIADLTSGAQQGYGQSANQALQFGGQTYDQSVGLGNQMFGGQAAQQQLAGGAMGLMGQPGQQLMGAGSGLSGLSQYGVGAQGPYEQDKQGQFTASTYPTYKQNMGNLLNQSGQQWSNIGGGMMGGGR